MFWRRDDSRYDPENTDMGEFAEKLERWQEWRWETDDDAELAAIMEAEAERFDSERRRRRNHEE